MLRGCAATVRFLWSAVPWPVLAGDHFSGAAPPLMIHLVEEQGGVPVTPRALNEQQQTKTTQFRGRVVCSVAGGMCDKITAGPLLIHPSPSNPGN